MRHLTKGRLLVVIFAFGCFGLGVTFMRGQNPELFVFMVICAVTAAAIDQELK
jgi:hypothetical protein